MAVRDVVNSLDLLGSPQVLPHVQDRHARMVFHVIHQLIEARPGIDLVVGGRHELRIDRVLVRQDDEEIGNPPRGQPVSPRLEDSPVRFQLLRREWAGGPIGDHRRVAREIQPAA